MNWLYRLASCLFSVGVNAPSKGAPLHGPLPPIYYATHGKGLVRVTKTVTVTNEFGWTVIVPRNFVCDGASIPPICWPFVGHPMSSDFLAAAVVHDVLCNKAALLDDYEHRVMADAFFFWLLKQCGVGYWRRMAMYTAVRFYGRMTFKPRAAENFQMLADAGQIPYDGPDDSKTEMMA